MFIVGILSWWYGPGWRRRAALIKERLTSTIDYFSIDLLLRTFFSPFRQISAGKPQGPLGVQIRAFFDRLISRVIGAMIRLVTMLVGIVAIIFHACIGIILLALWALIPLVPGMSVVLFMMGWMPWM